MSSADAQQLGDGYIGLVRWDRLFEDLESRVAAQSRLELDAEVAERTRLERARITLGERVAGAMGARVTAQLRGGSVLRARVEDSGDGWVLLVEDGGRQVLVPVSSVLGISGLGRPRDDTRARRFGLGSAVRGVSRDRRAVLVRDVDGGSVHGTIDAVGADAFDLAEHPLDSPRRPENVRGVRAIPFAAVAMIAST